MANYRYYIIPDLMTWARPLSGLEHTPIEYYGTIEVAAKRFAELRAQAYNNEPAPNLDTGEPYTRLCLGIEDAEKPSAVDLLHVRQGVHYLVDDYRRIESMKDSPEVLTCLHDVSAAIGFDRVRPYVTRKDEKGVEQLVAGKDRHISEWMPFHEFGKEQHFIRFPSLGPGNLFTIRDGQNVVATYMDGFQSVQPCKWIDDYHVVVGHRTWHIDEYADNRFRNGYRVRPQFPQPGDNCDSFSIYQIPHDVHVDYKFTGYDFAKGKLQTWDYACCYISNAIPEMGLEKIYEIFNRDARPGRFSMHSLSMSDIVVLNQGGIEKAFYVDTFGFEEIPGFAEKLHEQQELQAQQREAPTLDDR